MKSFENDQRFVVRAMLLTLIAAIAAVIMLSATRGGASENLAALSPASASSQSPAQPAAAGPSAQSADQGQAIFQEKCVACHTIGSGTLVGPDLKGVTTRRDKAWLTKWISQPDQMLARGDPTATQLFDQFNKVPMPNLGLTDAQVASLIAYLETQAGGAVAAQPPQPQPQPAQALPAGNPMIGRELFTGVVRFQNGGPPCMACHSIAGLGALGGGVLGPDLTTALNKYNGAAGLDSFLTGLPTATMNAVWGQKPPTAQERANLIAFLKEAAVAQRAPQALGQLALLAGLGGLLFLGIIQFTWRKRL